MDTCLEPAVIENVTFEELAVGAEAHVKRTLYPDDILLFAHVSGDVNPAHLDPEYAAHSEFHEIIAHGMWGGSLISAVLGTRLPGPGTIYLGQSLRFRRPVRLGDVLTVSVKCTSKDAEKHRAKFDCRITDRLGRDVITGEADVIVPVAKVCRLRPPLPHVRLEP